MEADGRKGSRHTIVTEPRAAGGGAASITLLHTSFAHFDRVEVILLRALHCL